MYFDPDGEKIYGNDGKYISYNNSKGWSSNTPKEFISFASNFMQYREGRRIMNQMLHSNVEYTVNFSSSYLPNEKTHKIDKRVMGNNAVFHDETTDEIKKSYITLSQPAISGRQEFKDLSDAQFTAGIFAHEYGHSTPPNHSLKTIEEKENHANTFRNMIFSEISIKTPLPKISWTIKPSIQ